MAKDHPVSDKRQKKPMVYKVLDLNEDITIVLIETYKNGKGEIRFNSPNLTSLFMSASDKALTSAKEIYNQLIKPKQSIREGLFLPKLRPVNSMII